jgi:hypothetical protein
MNLIWLASYPKSGNTWLRFFLYSYYYGIPVKSGDINEKIPDLHSNFRLDEHSDRRVFCKTHFIHSAQHPYNEKTTGFIYILRHPKDVLLSNLNYFRLTGHTEIDAVRFAKDFIKSQGVPFWQRAGMGSWSEHAKSWLNYKDVPYLVLKYETLRKDPRPCFSEVLEFLGEEGNSKKLELALQRSSFDNMKRLENKEKKRNKYSPVFWGNPSTTQQGLRFINKGGLNQTLEEIDPALDTLFDETFEDSLRKFGYL